MEEEAGRQSEREADGLKLKIHIHEGCIRTDLACFKTADILYPVQVYDF